MKNVPFRVLLGFVVVVGILLMLLLSAPQNQARESFCQFNFLTNHEVTQFNEIIWFWTYDSLYGRMHSNDYIGIKYSPQFCGPTSTSKEDFRYYQPGNIHFASEPLFGAPIRVFPTTADTLRSRADPFIESDGGRFFTRIRLRGADGIDIYQYRLGTPPNEDSLILHLDPPDSDAIFVAGQVEIAGVLSGTLTIGSAGDMWLLDDIRYDGANERNGNFSADSMESMLGLVSEKNIIIRDDDANGKENGWAFGGAPFQTDRHSIIITAAMLALGESFTFEHQNDNWDAYQGSEPDERGIIHLRGAISQWRRGYVHRSNHDGTGYGRDYRFDFRFETRRPPFFPEIPMQVIPGTGNHLYLTAGDSPYYYGWPDSLHGRDTSGLGYETINASPGTEIIMEDTLILRCSTALVFEGSEEEPVKVIRENPDSLQVGEGLICAGDSVTVMKLKYVDLAQNVKLTFSGDTLSMQHCILRGGFQTAGYFTSARISNCAISGGEERLVLNGDTIILEGSQFDGSLTLPGPSRYVEITDCTFGDSLTISRSAVVRISGGEFNGSVAISGLYDFSSTDIFGGHFYSSILLTGRGEQFISRCVIEGGVRLNSDSASFHLFNNNLLNSSNSGLNISAVGNFFARNNIITGNLIGVVAFDSVGSLDLIYNDCWGNDSADYLGVEPGLGSISADPMFVDAEAERYSLQPGSPCIDAGDPNSPLDPDGSRADIGVIPFDARGVGDDGEPLPPSGFNLMLYPNPFNRQLELRLETRARGEARVGVYDLQGRLMARQEFVVDEGANHLALDASFFGGSGIYLIRAEFRGTQQVVKAVYLP